MICWCFQLYSNSDDCDQRLVTFVARKADLLFRKPDVPSEHGSEGSHKTESMLLFCNCETICLAEALE